MTLNIAFCEDKFTELGFEILNIDNKKFVKIRTIDALRFSLIQGSSFLNNEVGTTLKGRCEVFIHRGIFQKNSLIYTPGLFGRDLDGNLTKGESFLELFKKYPEIFENEFKYIYLKEINPNCRSNIECEEYNYFENKSQEKGFEFLIPSNIILFKIYSKGTNLEPFLEYISSLQFIKNGYIIENQVPWFQQKYDLGHKIINGGIPDFSAFKFTFLNLLSKYGFYYEGMPIQEFSLLFLKGLKPTKNKLDIKYELKIGEAKISKGSLPQIKKQLSQYNEAMLADELFAILGDFDEDFSEEFGLFTLKNKIEYKYIKNTNVDLNLRNKDDEWMKIYVKTLLLGNLDFEIILNKIKEELKVTIVTSKELLSYIINSDDEEIIKFVRNNI